MEETGRGGRGFADAIAVENQVVLTGEYITNAVPRYDSSDGSLGVSVSFDRRGSALFGRLTRENVGRYLAIILDGKVYSAPVIKQEILGDASITGGFTTEQANDLALILRAGSLPAPVTVLEERSVGPSLGQESIDKGIMAAAVGGIVVILFMLAYYSVSGLIADIMLALDLVLIFAGMALFGATLTLPGIAGIVLTLGMAVDANVLIFERIREETRKGFTPRAAVEAGFSRAMVAIVDSNLTTIIAAAILYQFGTGPVRGFAVTLALGIAASMFTAVFISRIIFDIWMGKPGRKLRI
jgi:preprotein translocase subunit SecD